MKNKYIHILAARPNFVKAAPVIRELADNGCVNIIIHTNQHYDFKMSQVFFQDLDIPEPNYHLGIGSGTHAYQTGHTMIEVEKILMVEKPKAVIVYGDVNSTLAATLAAVKLQIPVYHIEAGQRSGDRAMPEEVNRVLVDHCSTLLFCIEAEAINLLAEEGISGNCELVGNTAIDSLCRVENLIATKSVPQQSDYYLATLHRPFNVDNPGTLNTILQRLDAFDKLVIIPAHPRLKQNLTKQYKNINIIDPLGYMEFLAYINNSSGVISDSGGVQCEVCFLRKPLLTVRPSTEHLITLEYGNTLVPEIQNLSPDLFVKKPYFQRPKVWDGQASKRIVEKIISQ